MRATAARSIFQSYTLAASVISLKPWAYATIFEAYSASRMSLMNATLSSSAIGTTPDGPSKSCFWASARSSACPDSPRANTASAIPVTGTARSSADCTVHVPVPFMPA